MLVKSVQGSVITEPEARARPLSEWKNQYRSEAAKQAIATREETGNLGASPSGGFRGIGGECNGDGVGQS